MDPRGPLFSAGKPALVIGSYDVDVNAALVAGPDETALKIVKEMPARIATQKETATAKDIVRLETLPLLCSAYQYSFSYYSVYILIL